MAINATVLMTVNVAAVARVELVIGHGLSIALTQSLGQLTQTEIVDAQEKLTMSTVSPVSLSMMGHVMAVAKLVYVFGPGQVKVHMMDQVQTADVCQLLILLLKI